MATAMRRLLALIIILLWSATVASAQTKVTFAVSATGGVIINHLVKLAGNPSTVTTTATTDTLGAVGIASDSGKGGTSVVITGGLWPCLFDNATTANDYVQISASSAGACHDAGATVPSSGQVIGQVTQSGPGPNTYTVLVNFASGSSSSGGGSPSGPNTLQYDNAGAFGSFASVYYVPAVCDGSTDNTTLVSLAIAGQQNITSTIGSPTLAFPPGECIFDGQLIQGQLTIWCPGPGQTLLALKAGSNKALFTVMTVGAGPPSGAPGGDITIDGCMMQSVSGKNSYAADGIDVIYGNWRPHILLERVNIQQFPQDGRGENTYVANQTQTGTTHTSTSVTALAGLGGVEVGYCVSGSGVPSGDAVATIASATSITLTMATTTSLSGTTLTFEPCTTGLFTNGSEIVSAIGSMEGFSKGLTVTVTSGSNQTVASIDSTTQIHLSANYTGTTGTYTFSLSGTTTFDGDVSTFDTNVFNNGRYGEYCNSAYDWAEVNGQVAENYSTNVVLSACANLMLANPNISGASAGPSVIVYGGTGATITAGSIDTNGESGIVFEELSTTTLPLRAFGTRIGINGNNAGSWYDADIQSTTGPSLAMICVACQWPVPGGNDLYNIHFGVTNSFVRLVATTPYEVTTNAQQQIDFTETQHPSERKNLLWGTDFNLNPWQRGTSFTGIANTATYTADGWVAFGASTSSLSVSKQSTSPPQTFGAWLRFGRANTDTNPFYVCQIVESGNTIPAQGQDLVVSLWDRAGAGFTGANLTVTLVTGSVADEGSTALAAGSWTNENAVSNYLAPSAGWGQQYVQFVSIQAATSNAAKEMAICLTYTPVGSTHTNDYIEVNDIQAEIGNEPTLYQESTAADTLRIAQRYFECSFDGSLASFIATTGASTPVDGGESLVYQTGLGTGSANAGGATVTFKVQKFQDGTLTLYSPTTGATGKARDTIAGADVSASVLNTTAFLHNFTWFATQSAANAGLELRAQWCDDAHL